MSRGNRYNGRNDIFKNKCSLFNPSFLKERMIIHQEYRIAGLLRLTSTIG